MPSNSIRLANNQIYKLDARPDRIDFRDRPYKPPIVSLPSRWPLRQDIDLATDTFREMVLDQGEEGACTGFGLAAVINYIMWKNELANLPRSERGLLAVNFEQVAVKQASPFQLYHLARVYDEWGGEDYEGSSCRGAVKGFHKHGVCLRKFWPEKEAPKGFHRDRWQTDAATRPLGAYYRVNCKSINDIQSAIYEVGAVYVSSRVHLGWQYIQSDDSFPLIQRPANFDPEQDYLGTHAYAIIGYEPRGFIIQNSWGLDWGFVGFAILPYEDWADSATDAWVTAFGAPTRVIEGNEWDADENVLGEAEFMEEDDSDPGSESVSMALCSFRTQSHSLSSNRQAEWFWQEETDFISGDQARQLNTEEAYGLTVVLENDGRPLRRRVGFDSVGDAIQEICTTLPYQWHQKQDSDRLKLMMFFHGGLNSETDSINRIRKMAPWFLANGIYPLFLTWRTSFLDSMMGIINDNLRQFFSVGPEEARSYGWWENIKNSISEATDRSIEVACQNLLVKPIWTQMKQNAEAASQDAHGLDFISNSLQKLQQKVGEFDLHLVGHSAGSLPIGHLLGLLKKNGIAANSCRLMAPACTMQFANEHYGPHLASGNLDPQEFYVYLLSDKLEKADSVGPYGKSLLYLVSRALEVNHKEPLLGMEGVWKLPDSNVPEDMWHIPNANELKKGDPRINPSIKKWHEQYDFLVPADNIRVRTDAEIHDGKHYIEQNHGNFDNDTGLFDEIISAITGEAPNPQVGDLSE